MSDKQPNIDKQALSARYPDLLDTQADADQLQLIDDLDKLYASVVLPGRPQGSPLQYLTRQPVAPGTPPAGSQNPRVVASRRKRWLNRLNAFAAVLVAAALVGSLLVATHLAHHSQQGNTPTSQCIAKQFHSSNEPLSYLHMIDATSGWAVGIAPSTGLSRILRTTDGGTLWQDVTPLQLNFQATGLSPQFSYGSNAYFLNACSAWVFVSQIHNVPAQLNAPALLFRTGDGGQTWQQFALPGNEIRGVDFIDARTGWLTVDVLKNGVFTEEDMYHSVDGGQTWQKIVNAAFPSAIAVNNLTFINATTGWITGSLSVNYPPPLYITHDGGQTWRQQLLPPPRDAGSGLWSAGTVVWRPQFFSATEGILPVSFWSDNGLDVYMTHDGGNSWQDTSLLRYPANPNLDEFAPTPDPIFVDSNHGWVSGPSGAPFLYMTSDGSKHWTKVVPQLNLNYIALFGYDFVTNKIGWAIGVFTGKSLEPIPPMLFKTEDGGKTWTFIRRG